MGGFYTKSTFFKDALCMSSLFPGEKLWGEVCEGESNHVHGWANFVQRNYKPLLQSLKIGMK